MHVFTVDSHSINNFNTFVPNFYYYNEVVKNEYLERGGKYITLGQYSVVSDGEHSAIPRNAEGGIRYLYGRNIREGIIDFDPISDDSYITEDAYNSFTRCHISEGDVLIAIYGTVGKSAVYRKAYIGLAGIPRHISNISLKSNSPISAEYLTAFFRSKYGKAQINSYMTGNIQQLFSLKSIREYSVPILPQKIMDEITGVEKEAVVCEIKAREKIDRAIELFYEGMKFDPRNINEEKVFTVSNAELFGSNIWSVSMYNNTFQKIEDNMEERTGISRLSELVDMMHGDEVGSDAYISYEDRNVEDIAFIRTSDIVNNEVDLYPDYYVSPENMDGVKQVTKKDDIIFTKDGKIGAVGMIVESDKVILSSGIEILRIKPEAMENGVSAQYIFTALLVPEVGYYGAKRRAVVASTIPHLRENRLGEIAIPIVEKQMIDKITILIKEAFDLKNKRKILLKSNENIIDNYFLEEA